MATKRTYSKSYLRQYRAAEEMAKKGSTGFFKGTRSAGTKAVARKYGINIKTGKYITDKEIAKAEEKAAIAVYYAQPKAEKVFGVTGNIMSGFTIHGSKELNDWLEAHLPEDVKAGTQETADMQAQLIAGIREIPIIGHYIDWLDRTDLAGRKAAMEHFGKVGTYDFENWNATSDDRILLKPKNQRIVKLIGMIYGDTTADRLATLWFGIPGVDQWTAPPIDFSSTVLSAGTKISDIIRTDLRKNPAFHATTRAGNII